MCSTYKISCKGISKGDLDAYDAENILEYVLDKDLDEANHIPLERCRGVAITGEILIVFIENGKKIFFQKTLN